MSNPFDNLLPPVRPVLAAVAADVEAAWSELQAWGDGLDPGSRMVACRWASVPPIDRVIDDVGRAFAGIALGDWPHWYGTDLAAAVPAGNTFARNLDLRARLAAVSRRHVRVAAAWLRRSAEHCLRGVPPFDPADNPELQAGQLALAVFPGQLVIVLAAGPDASAACAETLGAVAEWLYRVTGAPAVVLAPQSWRGSAGLERLCADPEVVRVTAEPARASGISRAGVGGADPARAPGELGAVRPAPAAGTTPPDVGTTPLPGRPHPNSEAEQLLFARIGADAELAPLLAFNQQVRVELGQTYRVDIVCSTRRVAIEVDGPEHRSSAAKYIADCERDYQLVKHGYVVLRLPNELVYGDTDVAVARIRDILRSRAGRTQGGA